MKSVHLWLFRLFIVMCLSCVLTGQKSSPRYLVLDPGEKGFGKQLGQATQDGYHIVTLFNQVVDERQTPSPPNGYGIFHSERSRILLERVPTSSIQPQYTVCTAGEAKAFESQMRELGRGGWNILPHLELVSRSWDWDATVSSYTAIFTKSAGTFDYRFLSPRDRGFEQAVDGLQKSGFRFVTLLGDNFLLEKVSIVDPSASRTPDPEYESVQDNKLDLLESRLNSSAQRGFRFLKAQSGVTGELISVVLERPSTGIPTQKPEFNILYGNQPSKLENALNELATKGFRICPAGIVSFTPALVKDRKTLFQAPDTAVLILERIPGLTSQSEYQVRAVQGRKLQSLFNQVEQEGSAFVEVISLRDKDLLITTKPVK